MFFLVELWKILVGLYSIVTEIFFDIFGYMLATTLYHMKEGRKEVGKDNKAGGAG